MNIRSLTLAGTAAGLLAAGTAAEAHPGQAYARVVGVEPIVHRVVVERPVRECWEETHYRSTRPGRVAASTVAGGVIGGVLGSAVGRNIGEGRSEGALLAAGAIAGSAIAHDRARRNADGRVAVPVERCAVSYDRVSENRVSGYWVTYRYRGRLHRVRTHEHPGDRIRLVAARRARRAYH
jgi:uncharacterized protein YcfJ